jgi:hypothetical protein
MKRHGNNYNKRIYITTCFCNGGDIVEDRTEGKSASGLVLCTVFTDHPSGFVFHYGSYLFSFTA